MRKLIPLFVSGILLAPVAVADPTPDEKEIPTLVRQLGDDNPKARDEASQKLRRIGRAALPALTEAGNSSDPEIVTRAQTLTRQIDEDLHPKPVVPDRLAPGIRINRLGPGMNVPLRVQQAAQVGTRRSVSIRRSANGEVVKDTTVSDGGKTIKIHESPDGIALSTTQIVQGKEETQVIQAKDKEALKKDHPDAFALYEKHTQPMDDRLRTGVGDVNVGGLDARTRADVERALADARRLAQEHRRLAEEQLRLAEQQMRELRQQLEEQQ